MEEWVLDYCLESLGGHKGSSEVLIRLPPSAKKEQSRKSQQLESSKGSIWSGMKASSTAAPLCSQFQSHFAIEEIEKSMEN